MCRVEYRHQETGRLLAQVETCSPIPEAGDRIYAPTASEAGVYAHHQVTGREFYYDQGGNLVLVKLACAEVSS